MEREMIDGSTWPRAVVFAALMAGIAGADDRAYPRQELLIEPAALAKASAANPSIVLDARSAQQFAQGHLPSARSVDHGQWSKAFGQGDDVIGWSKRIGELGIGADSQVVVYDDNLTKDAARIWWILRYWGVENVRLLNGGWHGWTEGKFPVDDKTTAVAPVKFQAVARPDRLATKDELLGAIPEGKWQIVDARSEKEYCGEEKMNNKRVGAMPGAKNLEWIDLLDKETQRFRSAAELAERFEQAGVNLDRPTVTHCQGGGRAAVMAFGLELMGAKHVGNYYSSWGEWGNADDTPITPGQPKASPKR